MQVVPDTVDHDPTGTHGTVRAEVVPGVADHLPAGGHRARAVQVEPRAAQVDPAGGHRTRAVQVVPDTVDHDPAGTHQAVVAQVVPGAADHLPAGGHRAGGVVVVPGAALHDPAGAHVAASVEAVGVSVDHHGGVRRVGAVSVAVPPADRVHHPGTHRGGGGLRVGSGLRLRLGLRVRLGLRLRLRLRLRVNRRSRLRLRLRRRINRRSRLRLGLRIDPRGGCLRVLLHGLHNGDRRRRCRGSIGQGGGQVHLIPINNVAAGDGRTLAVLGHLQDDRAVVLQAPGQGGVLELLGKQRLEGNSLPLLHVHAEVIDGNLVLAQLADADLDAGHHRVEDHRIHVVGDGPHVRAAFLLGSHEA